MLGFLSRGDTISVPEMDDQQHVTVYSVNARISAHELVCAERWGQIRASVKGLWWITLLAAGTLITGQAGLIVTLILRSKS